MTITVGYSDSTYSTINDAITYARTVCSESNRVLIQLAPKVYYESINLHPNPGIDMIGYGARIVSSAAYPEAALFTCHTGYFVGIHFESTSVNAYAVHIERNNGDPVEAVGGIIRFINCTFSKTVTSVEYQVVWAAVLGIGMSPGASVYLQNCSIEGYCGSGIDVDYGCDALYLHNAWLDGAALQGFHAWNCQIYSATQEAGYYTVLIDDAIGLNGQSGSSPLLLDFQGCTGFYNNAIAYRYLPEHQQRHIKIIGGNLMLHKASSGNTCSEANYFGNQPSPGPSITVDDFLSPTSTNPVQNKVIYKKIQELEPGYSTGDIEYNGSDAWKIRATELLNSGGGGGGGGTKDYVELENKPSINGVTLETNINESDPTVPNWAKDQTGLVEITIAEIAQMFSSW